MSTFGVGALYVKLHHGTSVVEPTFAHLAAGWADGWRARGVEVLGWGWCEGEPEAEARLGASLCQRFDLDGYIANAEFAHEGPYKPRSRTFADTFRRLAPRAPLAVSYIGYGSPHRDFAWKPWIEAGAALLPQAYTDLDALDAASIVRCADAAGLPRRLVMPSLGHSMRHGPYPAGRYADELAAAGTVGCAVWLIDSTSDDYLRALGRAAAERGIAT